MSGIFQAYAWHMNLDSICLAYARLRPTPTQSTCLYYYHDNEASKCVPGSTFLGIPDAIRRSRGIAVLLCQRTSFIARGAIMTLRYQGPHRNLEASGVARNNPTKVAINQSCSILPYMFPVLKCL